MLQAPHDRPTPVPTPTPETATAQAVWLDGMTPFLALRDAWQDALARGPDASPALEHDTLRIWLESFAPRGRIRTLLIRSDEHIDAGLVTIDTPRTALIPVHHLRTATNSHSTRGGVMLGPSATDETIARLARALIDQPWDVLTLRDIPADTTLDHLTSAFKAAGVTVTARTSMQSPWLPLAPTRDEQLTRLDGHFRQNLRRRRRRLEERGPVRVTVQTGLDGLDAALETALAIEASGWKGAGGTSISSRAETRTFYAAWTRHLARSGRLRLALLHVADSAVAFHFGFVDGSRYYLPKCGYREEFGTLSPGQLLTAEVMERCIAEGVTTFDFLGHDMPWKRDWAPFVRRHVTLTAYRATPAGRMAQLWRDSIRPTAGQLVRRLTSRRAPVTK